MHKPIYVCTYIQIYGKDWYSCRSYCSLFMQGNGCNTRSKYQSNFYSLYQCQSIFFCLFFQDWVYGHHLVLCLFLLLMLYSLYKQYFNRTTEAKALGNLVAQVHRQCGQTRFVRDTIMKYGINQITITPESLTDGRRD